MAFALGLDIGGTKILGVALGKDGSVLREMRLPSPSEPDALIESLNHAIADLTAGVAEGPDRPTAIGVGVPGLIDERGVLVDAPNLRAVEGTAILDALRERLAESFFATNSPLLCCDNDGTCAAFGERAFGAAVDLSDAIVITLGTGVGGGLVVGNRVVRGGRGFAGEIGHIVVETDGPLCPCGRRGCWEVYVSGNGHARMAREMATRGGASEIVKLAGGNRDAIESSHICVAARSGNPDALAIVDAIARYLALGIANLVEVLDPLAVILGGGVMNDGDLFLERTRVAFAAERRGRGERAVEIRQAALGERAGAIGAAAMALAEQRER